MLVHVVREIESERNWGQKVANKYYFPTEALAMQFCNAYDEKYNNHTTVPDWYIVQNYVCEKFIESEDDFELHKYKGDLVEMPTWEYT